MLNTTWNVNMLEADLTQKLDAHAQYFGGTEGRARGDERTNVREKIKCMHERERFIQSGDFKRVLGVDEKNSIVVTKDMLGKEKREEIKKELSNLK